LNFFLKWLANGLIFTGLLILALTFGRPTLQEINYSLRSKSQSPIKATEIAPVDKDFGIVIPKIGANARIFAQVDPFAPKEFLPVLKKGVAHAKGTSFPGEGKNIYLFAHSTDAFFNFQNYNAVFYLIGKLEAGDRIDIYYQNRQYQYSVFEKMVVSPQAIEYLKPEDEEILTLQTCYPPGTTLKRLLVRAKKPD